MKKLFLIVVITVSLLFSSHYSTMVVEKEWIIGSNGTLEEVEVEGFFLVNSSYQKIEEIESNAEMVWSEEGLKIKYRGENITDKKIYARATIYVGYQNSFPSNPKIQVKEFRSNYSMITPDENISKVAKSLFSGYAIETAVKMNEWVHDHITYDEKLIGKNLSAREVFYSKRGVCTHYSYLLMSLLESVGMESRMVLGYAYSNEKFQPHAWVEVKIDNYYLPLDPTFNEAGELSEGHVAMLYFEPREEAMNFSKENQSIAFDYIQAKGNGEVELNTSVAIELIKKNKSEDIEFKYNFENKTLRIELINKQNGYSIVHYIFESPVKTFGSEEKTVILGPFEKLKIEYRLNDSEFKEGYEYSIPFLISLTKVIYKGEITYSKEENKEKSLCLFPLIELVLFGFYSRS